MKKRVSVLAAMLSIVAIAPSSMSAYATAKDITYSYNGINSVDNIGQTYSGSGILYEKYTIGARTDVAVYKNVKGERVYNFNLNP